MIAEQTMKRNSFFLFVADCLLLSASFYLAVVIAYTIRRYPLKSYSPVHVFNEFTGAFVVVFVSFLFSFYVMGSYDRKQERGKVTFNILIAAIVGTVIITILYFFLPPWRQGRTVLLLNGCFAFLLVLSQRKIIGKVRVRTGQAEPTLIIADSDSAKVLVEDLMQHQFAHNLNIVGVVNGNDVNAGTELFGGVKVLGTYKDVEPLLDAHKIQTLVVSRKTELPSVVLSKLIEIKFRGVKIVDAGRLYMKITSKVPIHLTDDEWWLTNEGFTLLHNKIVRHVRRLVDFVLSLLALVLLLPTFLAVSALIKLTSKGPVFYRQRRVGEQDKVFTLVKFRTMVDGAESETGPVWSQEKDPRATWLGKLLRRTRLDEIPQFVNVLKGDMSLIGPRPERPKFVKELESHIPYYRFRHMIKPGLTGWAQVMYRYGASHEDAMEKLQYDLYYIQEMSLWLDLIILLKTIGTVLRKKGS